MTINWQKQSLYPTDWGDWKVACSRDGYIYLAAEAWGEHYEDPGWIYIKRGSGSWEELHIDGLYEPYTVACSGTGQYLWVGDYEGALFTSGDYGYTWTKVWPDGIDHGLYAEWDDIKVSDDGRVVMATEYQYLNIVFYSIDYGATFSPVPDPDHDFLSNVAVSPSGNTMAAIGWGIEVSTDEGNNWDVLPYPPEGYFGFSKMLIDDTDTIFYLQTNTYSILKSEYAGEAFTVQCDLQADHPEWRVSGNYIGFAASRARDVLFVGCDAVTGAWMSTNDGNSFENAGPSAMLQSLDMPNDIALIIGGEGYGAVWIGYLTPGHIKSISGVLLENIGEVEEVSINAVGKVADATK